MESGHGKGCCDGIGGAIKHYADTAVKKGVIIGNAEQFLEWAQENNEKMHCIYVSNADVTAAERILKKSEAVIGLSKCHALHGYKGYIYLRDMSCYKPCCTQSPSCVGWQKTRVKVTGIHADTEHEDLNQVDNEDVIAQENEEADVAPTPSYEIGSKVELHYNGKVWGGLIEAFSATENEYEIKFLKKNKAGVYICPRASWTVWIPVKDIIKVVD
jgi:hypothetical protein